jgi:hypothetical protein
MKLLSVLALGVMNVGLVWFVTSGSVTRHTVLGLDPRPPPAKRWSLTLLHGHTTVLGKRA